MSDDDSSRPKKSVAPRGIPPPAPIDFQAPDLSLEIVRFLDDVEDHFGTHPEDALSDQQKYHLLCTFMGREARDRLIRAVPDPMLCNTHDLLTALIKTLFVTDTNVIFARFEFVSLFKDPKESSDDYVHRLRGKAATCNMPNAADAELWVVTMMTRGLADEELQRVLL